MAATFEESQCMSASQELQNNDTEKKLTWLWWQGVLFYSISGSLNKYSDFGNQSGGS